VSAQLCQRYKIPLAYGTGGVSDSLTPDVRAGFEKGLSILANALSKVEVIHNAVSGLLASGMAISLEQLVIDNEIAHWVNRYLRGISVDEDHLALDVIAAVGPGGAYLDHEHTVQHCRQEFLLTDLLQREYQLQWPSAVDGRMLARTQDWVDETIAATPALEQDTSVMSVMQDALQDLAQEPGLYDKIMRAVHQIHGGKS
jgi:trimethylamine--corrinoid protein Co-methyltransferase